MITLGIDCGTQSLKTVAPDGDSGKVIASASKVYGLVEGLMGSQNKTIELLS